MAEVRRTRLRDDAYVFFHDSYSVVLIVDAEDLCQSLIFAAIKEILPLDFLGLPGLILRSQRAMRSSRCTWTQEMAAHQSQNITILLANRYD